MDEQSWQVVNDKKIFYRKVGTGTPVVLVHGFAEDGTIWDRQIDQLKNNFELIVPDLPGSGQSTNGLFSSIDSYADLLKVILDKEAIRSCIMIGHSMGGYVTLAFAEKYAGMLKGFGLIHSTAYADSEEKKTMRKKSIVLIQNGGASEFIKQSSPNLFSDQSKKNHPEIVEELIHRYDNFNPAALVSYYEAMMQRPDRTNVLRDFKGPILLILGEHDNAVPLAQSLQQSHIPGFCYIHILKNAGHMGMWEAPGVVTNFLTAFIKNAAL
jgi:pimeloyl-ACP methyl ester carboxylesterase